VSKAKSGEKVVKKTGAGRRIGDGGGGGGHSTG